MSLLSRIKNIYYWKKIRTPYGKKETIWWILKQSMFNNIILSILNIGIIYLIHIFWNTLPIIFICILIFFDLPPLIFWVLHINNWGGIKSELIPLYKSKIGNNDERCIRKVILNETLKDTVYSIGFLGDIMPLENYNVKPSQEVIDFFEKVDIIVGNMEGVIIHDSECYKSYYDPVVVKKIAKKKIKVPSKEKGKLKEIDITESVSGTNCKQFKMRILEFLKEVVLDKDKWLLSVSNNHAGDFQSGRFEGMLYILKIAGFNYFGDFDNHSKQFPAINKDNICQINIHTGTMWVNKSFKNILMVSRFIKCGMLAKEGHFNILYPHWHYENEPYVRRSFKFKSRNLLTYGRYMSTKEAKFTNLESKVFTWDFIFGHHSHIPQRIEVVDVAPIGKKFLAYSGGNFTSGEPRKKHRYGIISKVDFAIDPAKKKLVVKEVRWSFTYNDKPKDDKKGKQEPKYYYINKKKKRLKERRVYLAFDKNKQNRLGLKDIKILI